MNATTYTPELADAGRLASLIKCTQPDKRIIAAAIAEAFINGMSTKERLLAAQTARERAEA